jgi:hypothetical protein
MTITARITFALLTFALALLAACNGSAPPASSSSSCACPTPEPVPYTAGTRLVPFVLPGSDGSVVPDVPRMFDTERNEACRYVSPDGGPELRCLPDAAFFEPHWFADAACTQPIQIAHPGCPNYPKYVKTSPQNACFAVIDGISPLGPALPADALVYAELNGPGSCTAQPGAIGSSNVAFPVLAPVPFTAFVSASSVPFGGAP